jgi:hypothetical protein
VRLYNLNPVTHSLKGAWFQPLNLEVRNWVQNVLSIQLVPLQQVSGKSEIRGLLWAACKTPNELLQCFTKAGGCVQDGLLTLSSDAVDPELRMQLTLPLAPELECS